MLLASMEIVRYDILKMHLNIWNENGFLQLEIQEFRM